MTQGRPFCSAESVGLTHTKTGEASFGHVRGGSGQTKIQLKKILKGRHPTSKAIISKVRKVPTIAVPQPDVKQATSFRDVRGFVLFPQPLDHLEAGSGLSALAQPFSGEDHYPEGLDEEELAAREMQGEDFWV